MAFDRVHARRLRERAFACAGWQWKYLLAQPFWREIPIPTDIFGALEFFARLFTAVTSFALPCSHAPAHPYMCAHKQHKFIHPVAMSIQIGDSQWFLQRTKVSVTVALMYLASSRYLMLPAALSHKHARSCAVVLVAWLGVERLYFVISLYRHMQRLNSTHVQIRACPFTHRHAKPIYRTPHHTCACTLTPSAIIFQYVLGEERFLKNRKRWHDYMLKARWVKDCRAGIWVLVAGYWASLYNIWPASIGCPCSMLARVG